MSARQAALVNGAAGHALDFDDMGLGGTHPSVAIAPAVFALAEKRHAGGRALADALLAGYQALARISYASGWSAYRRGFHATGTVGTLAAAVAGCAKLLGLDETDIAAALGLAATQAAGLKVSFGTMAKHLNAGKAAANGLLAAELAAVGFTAAEDALEGHQGSCAPMATSTTSISVAPTRRSATATRSLSSCSSRTPRAAAPIRRLTRSPGRSATGRSTWRTSSGSTSPWPTDLLDMCGIPEPRTGLEGKFSLRHAAALALRGSSTGPSGFTDQAVLDPANRAARDLVHITRLAPAGRRRAGRG